MDAVFRALADPTRRRLLDTLHRRNGQTLGDLCVGMHQSRQSVTKHLGILEGAGLVTTARQGRTKLHFLNPAPIGDISERGIHRYEQARIDTLTTLRRALEDAPMTDVPASDDRTEFRYVTYIRTTPERLWQALTEPEFTKVWWESTALDTTWIPGSPVTWVHQGVTIVDPDQVVLEADPPRRLSYTWHTFTPEWARGVGFDEARRMSFAAEPRSTTTFDLEPAGDRVKLTVTQGNLLPGGTIVSAVSQGWPVMLSNLKSLLETGTV
jgi:DNA-binding transcriptional ArsR family regulator/uncharacterized protein YndB with AHSA1/START domain